jgi:hypothetical protein
MVGKRIIIIVIVVLLCSVVNVAAFADSVSQYSDTGGYDESSLAGGAHGDDIGILATPTVYHAPLIYPLWYEQVECCPHCRATGSTYIGKGNSVSGYQRMVCWRCSCEWLPELGGIYKKHSAAGDFHFHILTKTDFCPFLYGIDYGITSDGSYHRVQFYCPIHNFYSTVYLMSAVFEFNTLWGLRVVWHEDWVEPNPPPSHSWETPFVPPYDSFATLEPVSVDNVGDIVNDTAAIVKVVYRGFPYFSVLLTIAIACAFIVVVVRG